VLTEDQAVRIVSNLRAGDAASARRRGSAVRAPVGGGADTSATLELLSRATLERREVWIGFVDSRGTASQRVIRPVRVGGGVLEGENNERYSLHRITSAAIVED
jgi:predicted DNA-binding transcriptional regulator YafY